MRILQIRNYLHENLSNDPESTQLWSVIHLMNKSCILIFLLCVDRFRIKYSLRLYIRIALPYIYLLFFQQPVLMLNSSIDISAFSVGSVISVGSVWSGSVTGFIPYITDSRPS